MSINGSGGGGNTFPPCKINYFLLLLIALHGMAKAMHNWKVLFFNIFFFFLMSFLLPFWLFLRVCSWRRIAGWGRSFRNCLLSVSPSFQIAAYFQPLSKATAVKQMAKCGQCAPKMLKWITSTSPHSSLETKRPFDFGSPVELISLLVVTSDSAFAWLREWLVPQSWEI